MCLKGGVNSRLVEVVVLGSDLNDGEWNEDWTVILGTLE